MASQWKDSVTRILLHLIWFAISIFIILGRRFLPKTELREKLFGDYSRNEWNLLLDFAIQFMQSHRDLYLKDFKHYRFIDHLYVPLIKQPLQFKKDEFQTSYGTTIRGEWIIPSDEIDANRAILYFHGGAFCFCNINTHRHVVAFIARAARTRAFVFAYRRAPEFQYPCQMDDGMEVYAHLMSVHGGGFKPENIVFVGDSAGGCMAVGIPLHLKAANKPLPKAIAVMSPCVDFTMSSDSWRKNHKSDFLPSAHLATEFAKFYVPPSYKLDDPNISPIFADLSSLPPMLIQVSNTEQLYDDSVKLEARAKECNVKATLDVYDNQPHVFQAFGGKKSKLAISKLGTWIAQNWKEAEDPAKSKHQRHLSLRELISNEIL